MPSSTASCAITWKQLNAFIKNHEIDHAVIKPVEADIEDCFIALMKN